MDKLSLPSRVLSALKKNLKKPLIELPKSHAAIFGGADAARAGLPVTELDPASEQWQIIWRLYSKYLVLRGQVRGIYEGARTSKLVPYQS